MINEDAAVSYCGKWRELFHIKSPLLHQFRGVQIEEWKALEHSSAIEKHQVDRLKKEACMIQGRLNSFDWPTNDIIAWDIIEKAPNASAEFIGYRLFQHGHHQAFLYSLLGFWAYIYKLPESSWHLTGPFATLELSQGFSFPSWIKSFPLRNFECIFAAKKAGVLDGARVAGAIKIPGNKQETQNLRRRIYQDIASGVKKSEADLPAPIQGDIPAPPKTRVIISASCRAVDDASAIEVAFERLQDLAKVQRMFNGPSARRLVLDPRTDLHGVCLVAATDVPWSQHEPLEALWSEICRNGVAWRPQRIKKDHFETETPDFELENGASRAWKLHESSPSFASILSSHVAAMKSFQANDSGELFRTLLLGMDRLFLRRSTDNKLKPVSLNSLPAMAARFLSMDALRVLLARLATGIGAIDLRVHAKHYINLKTLRSELEKAAPQMETFCLTRLKLNRYTAHVFLLARTIDNAMRDPSKFFREMATRLYFDFLRCTIRRHQLVHLRVDDTNAHSAGMLLLLYKTVIEFRAEVSAAIDAYPALFGTSIGQDEAFFNTCKLIIHDFECVTQKLISSPVFPVSQLIWGWGNWSSNGVGEWLSGISTSLDGPLNEVTWEMMSKFDAVDPARLI